MADLIVILTEQALGAGDAKRITDLHAGEDLRYHVLVPADTDRNLLVDVIDHLSLLELRKALDAVRGREPSDDQARASATQSLAASLEALRGLGIEADGEVTVDDPLPAVQGCIDDKNAREVVVVTRAHAVEDTFHRDWASRARDELGVPVLHVYAGTTFLGLSHRVSQAVGPRGLVDLHVHFMPDRVLHKVWAYFDQAQTHYGTAWPVHYRGTEAERLQWLAEQGVTAFAPLVYAHRPGMAQWLTEWAVDFGQRTPGAVPTATIWPEPSVATYLGAALEAGARCAKVHVQVGGFDPRDPLLAAAWGLLAEAGVPVVVHCGDGPIPGRFTGLPVFEEVLVAHPRLVAVLAHAGMPDFGGALAMMDRHPLLHLDTTMVGTAFSERTAPLPPDWAARLVDVADRVALGSDFPNIPYPYAEQLDAIQSWADADDRLGEGFLRAVLHDTPARLLGLD